MAKPHMSAMPVVDNARPLVYSARDLLTLYTRSLRPDCALAERIHDLGRIWRQCQLISVDNVFYMRPRRGSRAGRRVQQRRSLVATQPTVQVVQVVQPSICPSGDRLVEFGCLNIRSLYNKVDDVLELFHERSDSELRPVDVLCLTETWHDCDSVCIRRFRALGYRVVERSRPRSLEAVDSLDVHHGGVAVIASTRVRLSVVSIDVRPTTFEFVGVRAVADRYASTVIVIYPPGSEGEVDFLRRARRRSGQSSHAV